MPDTGSLAARVRELLAGGAVILALGGGWYLVGPPEEPGPVVRVAAFNVQVFGQAKAGKPDVMELLARVAREFDVVLVQEVRDASQEVADAFLEEINAQPGPPYAMWEGRRLGRTISKEQYVAYYAPSRVELLDAGVFPDSADRFEREPMVATFRAGNFDFTVVAIHVKPDSAGPELAGLVDVTTALLAENPDERDVILMGDFNADCSYFEEEDSTHALRDPAFHWAIGNEWDTMITSDCTYDRIILQDATVGAEYIPGSARVYYFDQELGITDAELVRAVSDHYPVFAEFVTVRPDDD